MVVIGKVCGVTSNDRYLAMLVDNFNFLSGDELSASSLQSPATPLSTKRDLWDRSDVDKVGQTPPTKRRLPWVDQGDIPETPCPSGPSIDVERSVESVDGREEESAPPDSEPPRGRKRPKRK